MTGAEGLSCYTANLAVYLAGSEEDAVGRIARSVRLAVRTDLGDDMLAFSHHRTPLDGGRLEYRGAGDAGTALDGISAEIEQAGRCLVVANTGFLDWSTAGLEAQAPHLLLVEDRRRDEWHVVDRFTALLPSGGDQRPFTGWVSSATLGRCLTPIVPLPPEQRLRNALAFGFPRPLPRDGDYQWLERTERLAPEPARLEGRWLLETGSKTHYRVFVGANAPFQQCEGRRIADITDGTSNTWMVVESAAAVAWTKPAAPGATCPWRFGSP